MNMNNLVLLSLLMVITACGGGSAGSNELTAESSTINSATDDTKAKEAQESKAVQREPLHDYGLGATEPAVLELVENIEIDTVPNVRHSEPGKKPVEGLSWELTKFERYKSDIPGIDDTLVTWWRFNNDSSFTLREVHCAVTGYLDGKSLGPINLQFGHDIVVHPGESAMRPAVGSSGLRINSDGSLPFDKIGISSCTITVGEPRQVKKVDESIKLEFVEFKDGRRPTIEMSLTHDLSEPINVRCYYFVKIGDTIVDYTSLNFYEATKKDKPPGEIMFEKGRINGSKSIHDFDTNFNYDNLDCKSRLAS